MTTPSLLDPLSFTRGPGMKNRIMLAPLTNLQIIMGKFLGAMALYAVMLSLTLIHIAVLFWYGDPEWAPVASGYLGLLLMGGSFMDKRPPHCRTGRAPSSLSPSHAMFAPGARARR